MQKLVNNHEAKWTFFAKYWTGLQLKKFNTTFASNSYPHSEYVPIFYKKCMSILNSFIETNADIDFKSFHKNLFYKFLLHEITVPAKIETVCPNIDFKQVWSNFNVPYIDPAVRKPFWKLCHDVMLTIIYFKGVFRMLTLVRFAKRLKLFTLISGMFSLLTFE